VNFPTRAPSFLIDDSVSPTLLTPRSTPRWPSTLTGTGTGTGTGTTRASRYQRNAILSTGRASPREVNGDEVRDCLVPVLDPLTLSPLNCMPRDGKGAGERALSPISWSFQCQSSSRPCISRAIVHGKILLAANRRSMLGLFSPRHGPTRRLNRRRAIRASAPNKVQKAEWPDDNRGCRSSPYTPSPCRLVASPSPPPLPSPNPSPQPPSHYGSASRSTRPRIAWACSHCFARNVESKVGCLGNSVVAVAVAVAAAEGRGVEGAGRRGDGAGGKTPRMRGGWLRASWPRVRLRSPASGAWVPLPLPPSLSGPREQIYSTFSRRSPAPAATSLHSQRTRGSPAPVPTPPPPRNRGPDPYLEQRQVILGHYGRQYEFPRFRDLP
jgi:hypothetical protein